MLTTCETIFKTAARRSAQPKAEEERRTVMKKYETPKMELLRFDAEDVITRSEPEDQTPIGDSI